MYICSLSYVLNQWVKPVLLVLDSSMFPDSAQSDAPSPARPRSASELFGVTDDATADGMANEMAGDDQNEPSVGDVGGQHDGEVGKISHLQVDREIDK